VPSRFFTCALALAAAAIIFPRSTRAQQQSPETPPPVRQAASTVEDASRRFRMGMSGGIALDPELIDFGAHSAFGPVFHRALELRPGIEFGIGEVTTTLAINLEAVYTLPGAVVGTRWRPYVGGGPTFGLSHAGFETENVDNVDTDPDTPTETRNRFDFSDTDFNGGFNFIAGARNARGTFFELKATAWGISSIRMLVGFNF
jgi:hypothetical protein